MTIIRPMKPSGENTGARSCEHRETLTLHVWMDILPFA